MLFMPLMRSTLGSGWLLLTIRVHQMTVAHREDR